MFREPSNNSNGNTVDNQGRLVTCEHLTRRVTRTEIDGSIAVVADRWQGKRFNSPNDVVVKSDDSVWFTDPAYGIDTDNEGDRAEPEIDGCHVYRRRSGRDGRARDRRHGAAERPRLFARREHPLRRRHRRDPQGERAAPHPPLRGRGRRPERDRRRGVRRMRRPACSTAFASTGRDGSGRAPTRAFIATSPTER